MSGFIAIYRWRVAPQVEAEFRERWRDTTQQARAHRALGSCLTRSSDGDLVAIALWPDEAARTAAFEKMTSLPPLSGVERIDELRLDVLDDLWAVSALRDTAR